MVAVDRGLKNESVVGTERTYVTWYRFTAFVVMYVPFGALITATACSLSLAFVLPDVVRSSSSALEVVLAILIFGFGGGFFLFLAVGFVTWLVASAWHWEAVRADSQGMTFARRPVPGSRRVMVPWRDLEAVVLFPIPTGPPYNGGLGVGLRLLPGSRRPAGFLDPDSWWAWLRQPPLVFPTPRRVGAYRIVRGFDLDVDVLGAVIREYAPHVLCLDQAHPPYERLYTWMVPK